MFKTVSMAAVTAALVSMAVPSLAQNGTGSDPAPQPGLAAPGTGAAPDPAVSAAEPAPRPVEGQIRLQSENTILARDLLGAPVTSPSEESIGDIKDLIVTLDGEVQGVVIGVGGFLGIGEKSVAVEMDAISVAPDDDGIARIYLSATRADLEAAPAFETIAVQEANAVAREMQQDMAEEGALPDPETGTGTAPVN